VNKTDVSKSSEVEISGIILWVVAITQI
jgi:hypothetical protein